MGPDMNFGPNYTYNSAMNQCAVCDKYVTHIGAIGIYLVGDRGAIHYPQLMGHKPSATAEKHYAVRSLDLLRVHHEKIEAWMLAQAGVEFADAIPALHVVATT